MTSPNAADDDDATLVRRCLEGESEAWRALVDRYRAGMIELARRMLPAAEAGDVVDAVIADLWERRKLTRYEGRSSLRTWLGAVVINASLNARRRALARPETAGEELPASEPSSGAPSSGTEHELSTVLHDAIQSLPVETRTLVLMYYEQGMTLDRLSVLLGASKSTLSRGLRQAREEIRAAADRLARERWGVSLDALRGGVDLEQLDFDLRRACAGQRDRPGDSVSNS